MVYRALGVLLSHSGIFVSLTEFHENAGKWNFEIKKTKALQAGAINSLIQDFIEENNLQYQVALITIHAEVMGATFSGPAIAASTELPVITDLAAIDIELGGNGEFYTNCAEKLGIDDHAMDEVNKSICIAFMGILRWREEYNFLSSVTGAKRSSIGGAIWLGQEA
jgi:hypothetical protein